MTYGFERNGIHLCFFFIFVISQSYNITSNENFSLRFFVLWRVTGVFPFFQKDLTAEKGRANGSGGKIVS